MTEDKCPFCGAEARTPSLWSCLTNIAWCDPGSGPVYKRGVQCYEAQLAAQANLLKRVLEVMKFAAERASDDCRSFALYEECTCSGHQLERLAQALLPDLRRAVEGKP